MNNKDAKTHAGVVPACIARKIKKTIHTATMTVEGSELLDWNRSALLTERKREEIRGDIIARFRTRSDEIWELESGVLLMGDWESRLNQDEIALMKRLVNDADPSISTKTIRQIKKATKVPLAKVIGMLAKIESGYWAEYAAELDPRAHIKHGEHSRTEIIEISEADRLMAQQVKALAWTQQIDSADLRFGYPETGPFHQWIDQKLSARVTQLEVIRLLGKILSANDKTAEDEVKDIIEHAADEYGPKQLAQRRKAIEVYLARVLTTTGGEKKLQELGDKFGFTRQRAEQICKRFESPLKKINAQTPAIDRVLRAASRIAPASEQEINDQLRRFIGKGAGIECLNDWYEKLAGKSPLKKERLKQLVRGHVTDVTMYTKTTAAPWIKALIHHAGRDCQLLGCSNVLRVAGRLALKENLSPGQEAIETALESVPGFRWLDKETGWFTCFDAQKSGLGSRVKKIMAVATNSMGADEITAAIASDDQMLYRESVTLGLATPPVHIVRELLKGWDWLKIHQKGRFLPNNNFDKERALTEVEKVIANEIYKRGGIACRAEMHDIIVIEMGMTDVLLSSVLGSSPIFVKFEHGLYGLRGQRQDDDALSKARSRTRARAREIYAGGKCAEIGQNEFPIRVTEASLRHEQYTIAAIHFDKLANKTVDVYGLEDCKIGYARISQTGKITGLNNIFPEAKPNDYFLITLDEQCMRIRLHQSETLMNEKL